MKYIIILFVFFSVNIPVYSQRDIQMPYKKKWVISLSSGLQMSGIKSVDFVSHNIAPSLKLGVGVWFTPEIALSIGLNGFYFNTISDIDKHHYNYLFGEVNLNINKLFNIGFERKGNWNLLIHPGAGLFYNHYYNRPNICAHIGFINSIALSDKFSIFADLSFIVGWDIYQGDGDVLPSFSIVVCYKI